MTYNPSSANVTGPSGAVPIYDNIGLTSDYNSLSYDKTTHALSLQNLSVRGSGNNFYVGGPIVASGKIDCFGRTGVIRSNSDGAVITFDMNVSDLHKVTLAGDRTLAVTNVGQAQRFIISLTQDAVGSRVVTWWSGIKWPGGTVPILTTTPTKEDIFTFLPMGSGDYRGFTAGLNF